MNQRLIPNKRAETCSEVLLEVLRQWVPPCVLGSDNGSEFVGAPFSNILSQYEGRQWRTTSHSPEQNGKMEHFWRPFDAARHGRYDVSLVGSIIFDENRKRCHRSLGMTAEAARAAGTNYRAAEARSNVK
jgi:transposase InsO family protein